MDEFLTRQRRQDGDESARQRHRREEEEDRRRYGEEPRWRLDRDDEFASMARLVGDAVRGEDRPTMLLALGLSVITHVEAPWRALSPPHLLRPAAAGAAERFAAQFVATRLHFQVTITTSTSGTATVEALLTELRLAEQMMVGTFRQLEQLGVPLTKDAWYPVMCAAARILGIFATMRFGYLLGGAKVNKAWEEGWRKGVVDIEALWPTQKTAAEATATKTAVRGGRETPKGPSTPFVDDDSIRSVMERMKLRREASMNPATTQRVNVHTSLFTTRETISSTPTSINQQKTNTHDVPTKTKPMETASEHLNNTGSTQVVTPSTHDAIDDTIRGGWIAARRKQVQSMQVTPRSERRESRGRCRAQPHSGAGRRDRRRRNWPRRHTWHARRVCCGW
jgi:hypothetical protein